MEHKKQSGLSRILEYAGGHKKRLNVAGLRTIGAIGGAGVDSLCMRLAGSARGIIRGIAEQTYPAGAG